MTCCTSVWGDGTRGPLGICVPEGMLKASFIAGMNAKYVGKVYMFTSGSQSHFMNADTTVEFLEALVAPAYKLQRKKHKLDHSTVGMLQCDAFAGNFADNAGEHLRRKQIAREMNVLLPDVQPGGWSAKGQACDKINGHYKHRVDIYVDKKLGYDHNLLSRPQFEDCVLGPTGTLAKKLPPEEAVYSAIWAWETMDPVLFQWAFTAVGYISVEEMAEFNNISKAELDTNIHKVIYIYIYIYTFFVYIYV